ncbi:MAG: FKBP-type peptidyl-prolyl cis-trans isomerase N-terminal domain-containing protein [Luteolibacter sp.]|jgi:FKBP-type peptidyl-prolyl cis-trans isomerase
MIRNLIYGTFAATVALNLHAEEAPAPMDAEAVRENASYALGYRAGMEFSQQFAQFGLTAADLDSETFAKAFFKAMSAEEPAADPASMQLAMQALGTQLQEREEKIAAENLTAGAAFLTENAKRDGVTTTASGLQYEVLEKGGDETYKAPEGEGAPQKQFVVHYKGTTIDGNEFDASEEGEPMTMTLAVIDGFREALTTMPVGSKWKLFIPSDLAYGERRQSAKIGPNSTLVFELELVSIQDAPPAPQGFPFPMPGQ